MIHKLADCMTDKIGRDTNVWQFCVILPNAEIGNNCNICANVLIENDVRVGDNVTIKCGVQLWDGMTVEDDVFIGPNATFINDTVPRSKLYPQRFGTIVLHKGCSIGANATIIANVEVGQYAFVGAGSVVTKNIPSNTVWYGVPARMVGYITDQGTLLDMNMCDKNGEKHNIK